jgi:hypothetical protein
MARATLNFLIEVATFIVMSAMIATGVLLRFVLPPGSGERRSAWDLTRHEWGDVHFWLAIVLGCFVLVHLALHWGWVCSLVARWLRSADSPARPSSGLRRNLLGLGAVTAVVLLVGGFVWAAQQAVVEREGGGRQVRGGRGAPAEVERESGGRQFRGGRGAAVQPSARMPEEGGGAASEAPATTEPEHRRLIIAYYFHRTIRCPTCLSIEQQSREAIELTYGGELRAGTLEWHAVNIEEPGNEHFEKDFALDRQALTLVELQGAEVHRHKKLERVWELVEDPYGFQEYVASEVGIFLGGG